MTYRYIDKSTYETHEVDTLKDLQLLTMLSITKLSIMLNKNNNRWETDDFIIERSDVPLPKRKTINNLRELLTEDEFEEIRKICSGEKEFYNFQLKNIDIHE